MLKVSSYNIDKLGLQSDLKKYEDNSYLLGNQTEDNSSQPYNVQFEYIRRKFFSGETEQKAALLNTGSNLFSTISDIYASYVSNPVRDLSYDISKFVKDFVALGFATIAIERVDGRIVMSYVPAKGYFRENGIDMIARFYQDDDSHDINNYYILIQAYYPGYIENKLYKATDVSMLNVQTNVPLDTIPDTANLDEIVRTGMDVSSLFIVKEDEKEQNPPSIYQKIQNIVLSIDRNVVMTTTQFLQHVESYTIFKNITFPEYARQKYQNGTMDEPGTNGRAINTSLIGRNLIGSEESSIDFVNNENPLIERAIEYEQTMIRRLSGMTAIPQEFLGLEQRNSAVGQGSRALMHGSFIKRIERMRSIFDRSFRMIQDIVMEEDSDMGGYYRPDVFAKTDMELLEEMKVKNELGLLTKRKALMELEGLDNEGVDNFLEQLNEEKDEVTVMSSADQENSTPDDLDNNL